MITFLVFLVVTAVIAYAAAFYSGRFLIRVYPGRVVVASIGAVLLTVTALLIFRWVAAPLIEVKASSPEMGGLAWLLGIISYAITVAVSITCLVAGTIGGLKKPKEIGAN